ncbi:hypothetical protein G6F57_022433 [Rhizopus arrhizus]|nr:hypothetical protein G6F57_022433 [Rhizopus arrhizus]
MLDQHLLGIADGGEVVGPVPALHLGQVVQQLVVRGGIGRQPQLLACAREAAGHVSAGLIDTGGHAACLREP